MRLHFACAAIAAGLFAAASAHAGTAIGNVQMIYNVNPAVHCSQSARDDKDLQTGLAYCNEAISDPTMNHRGALLIDRGIVKFALNDPQGALADFNAGLAANPGLGDGYINRAALLISLKRNDEARPDIDKAMQLGASNLYAAYYDRAVIEDDAGDYQSAYHDYKAALAIKPDYTAAARELSRFKVTARTASNAPARLGN